MIIHTIKSGRIDEIQHDGEVLRVRFISGAVYDYDDVSSELVTNLVKAEDPSRYLLRHIMPDRKGKLVTPARSVGVA